MRKPFKKQIPKEPVPLQPESRSAQLCRDEELKDQLRDLYTDIDTGFNDQSERSDNNSLWWDIYNCVLNDHQWYNGNSQIYVPIVHDAVNARKTRFVNQIFPQNNRYVQVVTEDGQMPSATMSLLEHYIRRNHMRNNAIPALMKNGDVEGQYTVYVGWETETKNVAYRSEKPTIMEDDEGNADEDLVDLDEMQAVIEEKEIEVGYPYMEVISDNDLLVLPATSDSIEAALNNGGSVTVIRRWSAAKLKEMIAKKEVDKKMGEALHGQLTEDKPFSPKDTGKQQVDAAGIKKDARGKYVLVYETYAKLTRNNESRIYKIYYGGSNRVLSCKRNPSWADTVPVISCAVNKSNGSFKGISLVDPVSTMQYAANDAVNEGMDSAAYSMLPIIMTDPEKNPKIGSLVLSLAAIWETNPNDTQFAQFPQLWKDALGIVQAMSAQIQQSLSLNPSAITQVASSKKPTQADIANEQQIDVLTTADAVSVIEEGILTPVLHRMLELDHQYRDKPLMIMQHGGMGIKASMEKIDPVSMHHRYYIKWFGVEAARSAAQIQQQIAAVNILRGIPPTFYEGHKLNLVPCITILVENAFGPNLAPHIFVDMRKEVSVDPVSEQLLLDMGEFLPVHPLDNLQEHMAVHMEGLKMTGDPHGTIRAHIQNHLMAAQAAMGGMMGGMPPPGPGVPGSPGGAGPGLPGEPGQPRMGAQPGQAGVPQGPPGMIQADTLSAMDPSVMPRM